MEFYENRSKVQVDAMKWIGEIKNHLKLAGISQEDILNRDIFRIKVHKWQVDQEDKRKKKIWNSMDRREKESPQPKNERTLDSQKNKETSLSTLRSPTWAHSKIVIIVDYY